MATVNENQEDAKQSAENSKLNTWVAITIALLATFSGICKIKDDNICQGMQQAQADKIDHWSFYQARNIRQEIDQAAVYEMRQVLPASPTSEQTVAIKHLEEVVINQEKKKTELKEQAEQDQSTYDALNYRDDQFDLSDAAVALAISLLAVTALTHKRWLFWLATVPTTCGFVMGVAGLAGLKIHPDLLTKLLS